MTFRLTVAGSMDELLDPLVAVLSRPLTDPFATEIVAVPGDGIRSWLTERLAERLGASVAGSVAAGVGGDGVGGDGLVAAGVGGDGVGGDGLVAAGVGGDGVGGDGIVANVRFVFPSALVARATSAWQPTPESLDPWTVGALTWTLHELLNDRDLRWTNAPAGRTDLARCRSLADLFDRYALHRPAMVTAWEAGDAVDGEFRPLPEHLRWQPELWRAVRHRVGRPSPVEVMRRAVVDLRSGRLEPDLPERVVLVGLAGLPAPHLHVLSALSAHRDVHVFAPSYSAAVWGRVRRVVESSPPRLPLPRSSDPTAGCATHPLGAVWGRASREAHLVLTASAVESDAEIHLVDPPPPSEGPSLLRRLHDDVRADRAPAGRGGPADGSPPDEAAPADDAAPAEIDAHTVGPHILAPDDTSVRWHTCHGVSRQVEVLRDLVIHLLDEQRSDGSDRFEPRDVVVLCPDVPTYAPLLEAAFAGDHTRNLPNIPLRVADRSLTRENPLADSLTLLLDLLDRRFRASDLLRFARSAPVARRFGLTPDHLERLGRRIADTHVHWGADPDAQRRVGLPAGVDAHTWRHGLDQLLVSITVADPAIAIAAGEPVEADHRLGPSAVPALPDIDDDDLVLAGALADLVGLLDAATTALVTDAPVADWCATLLHAIDDLFAVADADAWQRRDLERELDEFAAEAVVAPGSESRVVPASEIVGLLGDRLRGRPGRVRFGTGAVTVSSLTAQRGVPHPVVVLLGLDGDLAPGGAAATDDLTQAVPCVGDRDPRSELRAQLLDAVLAARDRLIVISTGRDLRDNERVPPSVPLAELLDLIDATAVTDQRAGPASSVITVDHPRHSWSERYFTSDPQLAESIDPRPWSADEAALEAARVRQGGSRRHAHTLDPLPLPVDDRRLVDDQVTIAAVLATLENPARTLLRDRLGVHLDADGDEWSDLVPLSADGREMWRLVADQLDARIRLGDGWDAAAEQRWVTARRRQGVLPPMAFAEAVTASVGRQCDALIEAARAACPENTIGSGESRSVELDLARLAPSLLAGSPAAAFGRLRGTIETLDPSVHLHLTPNRFRDHLLLGAWFRLAVITALDAVDHTGAGADSPEPPPVRAVVVARAPSGEGARVEQIRLRSVAAAHEVVAAVLDLHARSLCDLVPAFPATARTLLSEGPDERSLDAAAEVWRPSTSGDHRSGDSLDRWVAAAWGPLEFADLLSMPVRPDDPPAVSVPPGRIVAGVELDRSRLVRWADRLWGTFEATVVDEDSP